MDFLDPKKNLRHSIIMISGYLLIAIAIALGTIVLLYSAYGYGFGKNGTIIQNGFLYLSSTPNPANITLNGVRSKSATNTRLLLPEGIYNVQLTENGYRPWTRSIQLDGGTVESFTYPLLIPTKLTTTTYKTYSSPIVLATESPSRQWLVVLDSTTNPVFDLYNLSNPTNAPSQITFPAGLVSTNVSGNESWQVVAWADDNQHVLLAHNYNNTVEYLMLDIANPSQSFNLSTDLASYSFSSIGLNNDKYNQYYLYNGSTKVLTSVSLSNLTQPVLTLNNVDAYNTYGNSTVVYATSKGAPAGKEIVDVLDGGQTYKIKELDSSSSYYLDMTGYNGTVYVAAGDQAENRVYIYEDPVGQIQSNPSLLPVPSWVLFVKNLNYLSFSDSAQFIMAEGGQEFGVYDIDNSHGYNYDSTYPVDPGQIHATWMDGDRMTYVTGGKLLIFEYDDNYPQTVEAANPNFTPIFPPNYKGVYTVDPSGNSLTYTSFRAG